MKNMIHLQREHLISLKLDGGSKEDIQKVQQAIDNGSYGHKEFRLTRKKMKPTEFLNMWGNPPEIEDSCVEVYFCLLYTSPSPRDRQKSRMPSSA